MISQVKFMRQLAAQQTMKKAAEEYRPLTKAIMQGTVRVKFEVISGLASRGTVYVSKASGWTASKKTFARFQTRACQFTEGNVEVTVIATDKSYPIPYIIGTFTPELKRLQDSIHEMIVEVYKGFLEYEQPSVREIPFQ